MKCWFCDKDAKGTCAACGRGLCVDHAHFHDELTLAKSDTSTGYAASITFTMRSNVRIVVWNGSTIARPLTEFKKRTKIRAPFVILHCALCGSYASFLFLCKFLRQAYSPPRRGGEAPMDSRRIPFAGCARVPACICFLVVGR